MHKCIIPGLTGLGWTRMLTVFRGTDPQPRQGRYETHAEGYAGRIEEVWWLALVLDFDSESHD